VKALTPQVLVLGIGNLLWADEGFGVRAVQALHEGWAMPHNVSLLDGGTQGLYLLEPVCAAQRLLVFDAIDYGLAPGELALFRDDQVPVWSAQKMSLHQASFQELLSLARLQGRLPQHISVIGVQPVVLDDLGGSLSPAVRARVPEAVALALAELARWGVAATARAASGETTHDDALCAGALALAAYEAGRPAASLACRIGDARFMPTQALAPAAEAW
jgi:hydrogenase maturation protease